METRCRDSAKVRAVVIKPFHPVRKWTKAGTLEDIELCGHITRNFALLEYVTAAKELIENLYVIHEFVRMFRLYYRNPVEPVYNMIEIRKVMLLLFLYVS